MENCIKPTLQRKGFRTGTQKNYKEKKSHGGEHVEQEEGMLDEYGGAYVGRPTTHVFKYPKYDKNRSPIDTSLLTKEFVI